LSTAAAAGVQAQQFNGYSGNPYSSGGDGGDGNGNGNGDGSNSNGNFGNFQNGAGFDIDDAMRVRAIHGVLAAVAMVILFPGGSILMRIIPGRFAIWAHGLAQLAALCVFVAGVALGFQLVRMVRIPGGNGDLASWRERNNRGRTWLMISN